jgi:hypothetical protein
VTRSAILNGLRTVSGEDLGECLEAMGQAGTIERRTMPGTTRPTEQWRLVREETLFGPSEYSDYLPSGCLNDPNTPNTPNGHHAPESMAEGEEALV